jgi:hypothetical protein
MPIKTCARHRVYSGHAVRFPFVVMAHLAADNTEVRLFVLPATPRQTQIALAVAIALLAGLGASAPFADTSLPRNDAFVHGGHTKR